MTDMSLFANHVLNNVLLQSPGAVINYTPSGMKSNGSTNNRETAETMKGMQN